MDSEPKPSEGVPVQPESVTPVNPPDNPTPTPPVEPVITPSPGPENPPVPAPPVEAAPPGAATPPNPVAQVISGAGTTMPVQLNFSLTQFSANGEFPLELRKWNWGAFFLNWIWSIGNNTYIGLLSLVPVINIYIVIALGMKGNEWAWKNRKFKDVEDFKKTQKIWAWWGLGVWLAALILGIVLIIIGTQMGPKNDETRKNDVAQIVRDLNAYGADPINGYYLPYYLSGLGKTEPVDPVDGTEYSYTPSDSLAQAEVCATLTDLSKYCLTAKVTIPSFEDETESPSPSPTTTMN